MNYHVNLYNDEYIDTIVPKMEANRSGTVENWLGRLGLSTQKPQRYYFQHFLKWIKVNGGKFSKYSPDELVEYQKQADNGNKYDILDTIVQPYVRQVKGTYNTKRTRYTNVRSFFLHNRAELPRDPNFKIRPDRQPVNGKLEPDEIKRTILSSSKVYQAVFLVMFQSAMDQEMFSYWNENGYDDLKAQLLTHPELVQINLPGRKGYKNIRPFYTFIGSDAIDAVRSWLKERDELVKNGKISEDDKSIFTGQFGTKLQKHSLRQYWLRRLRILNVVDKKKGPISNRTGKGLHELRDTFRTLWSKSPASSTVCEYLMGHSIDKLGYDKSYDDVEFYKNEYKKALPFLQIISGGAAFGQVQASEVEELLRSKTLEQNGRIKELEEMVEQLKKEHAQLPLMLDRVEELVDKLVNKKLREMNNAASG